MSGRVLALDPGGSTGFSVWVYSASEPLVPVMHGQIPGGIDGFVAWWRSSGVPESVDEIVSESFVLDGRAVVKPDVTPLRIEGALAALWPGHVTYQRNTFKAHAPDELLKRIGFWWPGEQHARDSARHALALMKTRHHMPTLHAYWGRRRGLEAVA